jgi:hypothetical protein
MVLAAGATRKTTMAAANTTMAPASQVMCMACMKAFSAGSTYARAGPPIERGTCRVRVIDDSAGARSPEGGRPELQVGVDPAAVDAGQDRAEDGDADRAADLAEGVVHRRAGAGLVLGQGGDDLGGRRRQDVRHPGPEDEQDELEIPDRRRTSRKASPSMARTTASMPATATLRAPKRRTRAGSWGGEGDHRAGQRQDAHPGMQRAVAPDALQVEGHDEGPAEQREEQHRECRHR